jgi:hypothetical protein
MRSRPLTVSLSIAGADPAQQAGVFQEFTMMDRVRRSATIMLVAVLLAATLIPIPIVHLLGIPLLLLIGAVTAIRQLSMIGRLQAVRIPCPKCGEPNQIGGGLGRSSLEPHEQVCDSCRRTLTMSIRLDDEPAVAEKHAQTS